MPSIVFIFRTALYSVTLLIVSFVAVVEAGVFALIGKRYDVDYIVARTFYNVAGPIMGWKFIVEGEEHLFNLRKSGGSSVMVGNHQSFVDIMYLARIFPPASAITAKKSLSYLPGLGWFMLLSGTVFINRSSNKSAVAAMTEAGAEMKRKKISLFLFPEGTRHNGPELTLPTLKKGAFHLAVNSGTPIIPIICQNYHHMYDGKTRFKSGTLRIKVLPPIPTADLTTEDVPDLVEKTRNLMIETLQEIAQPLVKVSDSASEPLLATRQSGNYDSIEAEDESDKSADEAEAEEEEPAPPVTRAKAAGKKQLVIAMVSDFYLPVIGGIETTIYSLSVELIRRGHKVVVITHHHPDRVGVRYLAPGVKVYHLPYVPIASSASLPNFLLFLPYFRNIILREKVDIVHGHGSLSSLAHEALYHAPLFGVKAVFTDHSLFGLGDAVGILTNKLLAGALRCADGVMCVSHTGRENTVLRAQIDPSLVHVIPNALEVEQFRPDPARADPNFITIVVVARLVYRKGIDLLVASAPHICELFPNVRFVIGGDGPKMVELEQMREKYLLQDRIELLGRVRPADVRGVLNRGQIYCNTSLTESFGISILEAASAGLFVVSTKVGGVPEILPPEMIEFSRPDEDDLIRALTHAIHVIQRGEHDPWKAHDRVRGMYSWEDVATRTEVVYHEAMRKPHRDIGERLARYVTLGPLFGPIVCIIIAVQHYFLFFLDFWAPRDEIEVVDGKWSHQRFAAVSGE